MRLAALLRCGRRGRDDATVDERSTPDRVRKAKEREARRLIRRFGRGRGR